MFLPNWLRPFRPVPLRRLSRPACRFVRPQLEALEERITPTGPVTIQAADAAALQQAVQTADANPTQQYVIQLTGTSPYNLTTQLALTNTAGVTITPTGPSAVLNAAAGHRVFEIDSGTTTLNGLTITGGNVNGSDGGGVLVLGGTLNLTNSTVSGNTAIGNSFSGNGDGGGLAVESSASATIVNSTIFDNTATPVSRLRAGGLLVDTTGTVMVENSTVAGNKTMTTTGSGGIDNIAGTTTLVNSIVAGNTNVSGGSDLSREAGTVNATDTLIQNLASGTVNGTNVNNLFGANPQLGPLQNNGGGTNTLAITTTSPAFAAGNPNLVPSGSTTDQRGTGFSRVVNGQLDLGAFQIQAGQVSLSPSPVTVSFNPAGQNVTLSATVTASGVTGVNEGQVTFTVLGQTLTATVTNGVARATLTVPGGTVAGTYTIGLVYSDPNDLRGSSSAGTLIVESAPTSVSVSSVSVPFTSADPTITLSATITGPGGSPVNEGQVQFVVTNASGSPLGSAVTANVSNGRASTSFAVPAETPRGVYTITANYSDPSPGNFAPSRGTGTLTVVTSPTSVVITNVNIVYTLFGEQETFTAVVLNALGQTVNSGFVTFADRGLSVTVPLVNSLATGTLNVPLWAEGPFAHPISAAYGDRSGNFFASTSLFTLEQTIMDFWLQILALELFLQSSASNP